MHFFNSLLIRITLAVIGGIFYAFLTYLIVMFLNLSYEFVILAAVFVYFFCFSGYSIHYFSHRPRHGWVGRKTLWKYDSKSLEFFISLAIIATSFYGLRIFFY